MHYKKLYKLSVLIVMIIIIHHLQTCHASNTNGTGAANLQNAEQHYQTSNSHTYTNSQSSNTKSFELLYNSNSSAVQNQTSMNMYNSVRYINTDNTRKTCNELSDKREYTRYYNKEMSAPVAIKVLGQNNIRLSDISRGGVGLLHNNTLHKGDILPVKIVYKDISIPAYIKVLTASNKRAGAMFINLDKPKANKLLYLSIVLESDNNQLVTRFRQ